MVPAFQMALLVPLSVMPPAVSELLAWESKSFPWGLV
jgi:hypothetical protein